MAEHGMTMSHSHSSDDESSDQQTPYSAAGGSSSHRQPPPSAVPHGQIPTPPSKKPRGRPPGSKNKPKPPLVIAQDSDLAMKPVVIEVGDGTDVLQAVIQFAQDHSSGITIMSASGSVSNVTLCHPFTHTPAYTLHGPFTLLALTGTYLPPRSHASTHPPVGVPSSSSSSSSNPNQPPPGSFGISFTGSQGQIFGGVVGGKVVAGSSGVMVMATLFKNPEFHRVGVSANQGDEGGDDNPNAPGGGGGGGGSGSDGMTGFNVANPTPLNCQLPSDAMQWGHTRPPNY